jgi:hypothetical protein
LSGAVIYFYVPANISIQMNITEQQPIARKRVTADARAAYLAVIETTGSHPAACKAIGYSRRTMASHIEAHPDFAEDVADAKAVYAAVLLDEAHRRAVEGLPGEFVMHEGAPVRDPENPSTYLRKPRRYSDKLLALMLERVGPETFRAPTKTIVEHTGTVRHAHAHLSLDQAMLARMPVEARLQFYRASLIHDSLSGALTPGAAVQRIAELVGEAQSHGIDIDGMEIAREARIGKFAELPAPEAIDGETVEVEDDEIPNFL